MRELARLLNEDHRYFPEWADRPGSPGPPLEADHNSYLAGGYSEEFGYRVCADQPPVFSPLEEDPDDSPLWYVQITGLHPGYPECARPEDRDHFGRQGGHRGLDEGRKAPIGQIHLGDSVSESRSPARPIRVIRVGERAREAAHHKGLATRLISVWAKWRSTHRGLEH